MSIFSFGNPVLLRGVDTRTLMNDPMFLKIIAQNIIEIFCAIINTKYLDFCLELCLNHGMEIDKYSTNLNFFFQ